MKREVLIFSFILLLVSLRVGGQYYSTGQDPAGIKWEQISTPHFRVIFPATFLAEAQKYASLLEESYKKVKLLYPDGKARIPVIIHNYSMTSNGYVSWAPRRMELFPLPGLDNLPMDPAEQLVIHETTHVLQMASLNRGLTRFLVFLLGEQALGLSAIEIPDWAFEGDAVFAETVFTNSGRGRSNAFMQGARALTLSPEGIYGYDKLLSGSYRNFTPDHYVFGYLMMNELRSQSPDAWVNAMTYVAKGVSLNPVNRALREKTGLRKKTLFDATFDSLRTRWDFYDSHTNFEEYPMLNISKRNDYVNYFMPQRIDENRIISLKTSLSHPSCFVISDISTGEENIMTTTGYVYPYIFSYSDGSIVWSELHQDPRWDNRDYSVVKKMTLENRRIVQLTTKTRYTAPDLSPDGKTIVAASSTPDFHYSLVFLDSETGEKKSEVATPDNVFVQRPAWSQDGKSITVVTLDKNGEGVRSFSVDDQKWIINIPESPLDIIQAEYHNDTLLYLAQGDGSDNLYRIISDTLTERITRSRFGISGFSVAGNEILFSDYSASGFKICHVADLKNSFPAKTNDSFLSELVKPDSAIPDTSSPTISYKSKPYKKFVHLLNPHSWMPFYANIEDLKSGYATVTPGLTLLSQNHLSTLTSTLGYEYVGGEHYFHSRLEWSGWYPVIEGGITYGGEQAVTKPSGVTVEPSYLKPSVIFDINVSLPLYFSYGKFRQLFMPAIYIYHRNSFTYLADNMYDEGNTKVTGRIYFSNIFRTAYRDIYPRWGQVIDLRFVSAPMDKDIYGSLRSVRGFLFLPGVVPHHSIMIKAGYEDQSPSRLLLYYNQNTFPRGYDNLLSERLFSMSFDYTMPLFYPDFSAGGFFYLKRIRSSLFVDGATGWMTYDLSNDTYKESSTDFGSFGGEILADFFLLRFPFELSAGISGGYIPGRDKPFVNAVFTANIYGNVLGRKR